MKWMVGQGALHLISTIVVFNRLPIFFFISSICISIVLMMIPLFYDKKLSKQDKVDLKMSKIYTDID